MRNGSGAGSGDVSSRCFVTVEQAPEAAGFTVTTGDWLAAYEINIRPPGGTSLSRSIADESIIRKKSIRKLFAESAQVDFFTCLILMGAWDKGGNIGNIMDAVPAACAKI